VPSWPIAGQSRAHRGCGPGNSASVTRASWRLATCCTRCTGKAGPILTNTSWLWTLRPERRSGSSRTRPRSSGLQQSLRTRASGKLLWKRDLAEEFGATYAGRKNNDTGYGASPIAYGNAVIVPLGRSRVREATPGQSLIALDQVDGRVLWKALDFDSGFASPVLIEIDGRDQLVLHVKGEVIGVDPKDGRRLWSQPMTSDWEPNVTPVWDRGNGILVIDGEAARLIELTTTKGKTIPREAWSSSKMNAVVPTPVLAGERFYGSTRTMLVAISAKTGEHGWTERGFPLVSIVHAGGKLILLDENGQLTLATPGPEGLTERSRCTVTEKYSLTAPALAGTTLFIRDRKRILALAVG